MLRTIGLCLGLVLCWTTSALAQCSCNGCGGQESFFDQFTCGASTFERGNGGFCQRDPVPCFPDKCCRYISLFGGWADVDNFERTIGDPVTEISGASLVDSHGLGTTIGWQLHPNARSELEFTYRDNDPTDFHVMQFTNGVLTSSTTDPATGNVSSYSGMVNFLFDFDKRRIRCANLYGGGGIGVLWVEGDISTAANNYAVSDSSFAYQFIGGLNYPLNQKLDLFTEYRYLGADYINVQDVTGNVSMGDFAFDSHNLFFGVRIRR